MNASQSADSTLQAATILSLLDPDLVQRVRAGLTENQRARLDAALEQVRRAPDEERIQLVRSFTDERRWQARQVNASPQASRVETPKRAEGMSVHEPGEDTDRLPVAPPEPPSFAFVTHDSAPHVATCLAREMPQIAALVLQRVSPEVARAVLKHMPDGLCGDVAVALAHDAPAPAPGALGCIARALEKEVGRLVARDQRRRQGMLTVARALAASESEQVAREALHALAERDENLAHSVAALLGFSLRESPCPGEGSDDEAPPELCVFSSVIPAPQLQVVPDC
ncbi:MAG: hypothetical protein HPY44_02635 [Armatimonadetes bacterium]|nr:hypothetical protein [Armatimonadota bacterium]